MHTFSTKQHDGLSQFDSAFIQLRRAAMDGRELVTTVEKEDGKTTVTIVLDSPEESSQPATGGPTPEA